MPKRSSVRNFSLDVIRSIAILMVVCEHASPSILVGAPNLLMNTFGTIGVPLFVMLSGYLLLDRDYNTEYAKHFTLFNILPLIVSFEIWNIVWCIISQYLGQSPISVSTCIKVALFMSPTGNGMWYLPMIIGLYIGIPIVSRTLAWLQSSQNIAYRIVLLFCCIFFGTFVPTLNQLSFLSPPWGSVENVLNMNIFGANVWGDSVWMLYLILGYLIKRGAFNRVHELLALVVMIVSGAALVLFHHVAMSSGLPWDTYYSNIFLVICSVCVFIIIERLGSLVKAKENAICHFVTLISKYSFGIYMIHFWILELMLIYVDARTIVAYCIIVPVCIASSIFVCYVISNSTFCRRWLLLIK